MTEHDCNERDILFTEEVRGTRQGEVEVLGVCSECEAWWEGTAWATVENRPAFHGAPASERMLDDFEWHEKKEGWE